MQQGCTETRARRALRQQCCSVHQNAGLAFLIGRDGSHSVLSPEKMGPIAINIPLVFPVWHGKPQELGLMMSPHHTILIRRGKCRRERADVEAEGNR